jgi:hypothetical protein
MSGWARSAWIRSNPLSFTGFGPYSGPLAGRGVRPFGVTDEGPSRSPPRRRRPLALVAQGQGCSRVCSPSAPWARASISPPPSSLRVATANPEPHPNPTRAHPAVAARPPRAYPRSSILARVAFQAPSSPAEPHRHRVREEISADLLTDKRVRVSWRRPACAEQMRRSSAFGHHCVRAASSRLRILPVGLRGSSSRNTTSRGTV